MADFDPIQAGAIAVQDDQPFDPLKAGAIPAEKEASPTPETDKALATTAAAAPRMPASVFLGQSGTNYRPEDSFDPTKHPIAEKVAGAAVEKLGGMIPRSALDVAGMATPVVPAIQSLISDAHTFKPHFENAKAQLSGQPLPHPEIAAKTFDQFNQDDWIRFGVSNAVDLANVALLRKGMFRAGEPISKAGEAPITSIKAYRGEPNRPVGEGLHKFYSSDPKEAAGYGEVKSETLQFSNPLIADNWMDAKQKLGLPMATSMPDLLNAAQSAGHDGIIWKHHNKQEYVKLGGELEKENEGVETQRPGQEEPQVTSPLASTVESAAGGVPESASAAEPPQMTGASAKAFSKIYGPDEIVAGGGMSPDELFEQAQSDLASGKDPYAIADRARTGAVTPREFSLLVAEHDRLVNEAAAREGTPEYEPAYQASSDFARNVLKPAETRVSDSMRAIQIKAPIDFSRLTGFRRALQDRMGREMTEIEKPAFQRIANDVAKARTEDQGARVATAERVQNRYAGVKDISFDEAVKHIHDSITEAVSDCIL